MLDKLNNITQNLDETNLIISRLESYTEMLDDKLDYVSNKDNMQRDLQSLNYSSNNDLQNIKEKIDVVFKLVYELKDKVRKGEA